MFKSQYSYRILELVAIFVPGNRPTEAYHRAPAPHRVDSPLPTGPLSKTCHKKNIFAARGEFATLGTCCFFAAALRVRNQPPQERKKIALAKPPAVFFSIFQHPKCRTNLKFFLIQYIRTYFAEISCISFRESGTNMGKYLLPTYDDRYLANVCPNIFCAKVSKGMFW